jgi:hypothetical protein
MTITDSSALWKWVVLEVLSWKVVMPLEISVAPTSLLMLLATETPGARINCSTSSFLTTRGSDILAPSKSLLRLSNH